MPELLTLEELDKLAGVGELPKLDLSAQTGQLSLSELDRLIGIGGETDKPKDDRSWLSKVVESGLKKTSVGIGLQTLGAIGPPPSDLGTAGEIGSEILGFVADPVTLLGGVLGAAAKEAVTGGKVAERVIGRMAQEAIVPAVQMATLEAGREAAAGNFRPGDIASAGASGALFGPAGQIPTKAGKLAGEVAAIAAPGIIAGQPVGETLEHAIGTVLGFKLSHAAINKLAALRTKGSITRKDFEDVTGQKPTQEQTAEVRNAMGDEAVKIVEQEVQNADQTPPSNRISVGEGVPGEPGGVGVLNPGSQGQTGQEVPAKAEAQKPPVLTPEGERARPDLAMPVTDPNARAALNEADRLRNEAGEPKVITDEQVQQMASERIAKNGAAERERLKDTDWVPADDGVDTAVAVRVLQAEGQRIPNAADPVRAWRDAVDLSQNYREGRSSTARELRQGNEETQKKALAGLDKGDGQAFFTVKEIAEAPERVQKKIDKAREEVKRIKREAPKVEPPKIETPTIDSNRGQAVSEPTQMVSPPVEPSARLKAAQQRIDDLWAEITPKWAGNKLNANPVTAIPEMLADAVRLASAYAAREGVKFADFYKDAKKRIGSDKARELKGTLSVAWKQAKAEQKAVEPGAAFKIKTSELDATQPAPPKGFKAEPKPKKQGPETETSYQKRLKAAQARYDTLANQWATELVKIKGQLSAMGHDVDAALVGKMDPQAHAALVRDAHALKSTTGDKLYEWWSNSILSGPATQVTNAVGNVAHGTYYFTVEKTTDAILGSIARSLGYKYSGAYFGELKHVAKALMGSGGKAWNNFLTTWRTEIPQFYLTRGLELEAPSGFQRAAIAGNKGKLIRTPWRLLAAVDDMTKTLVAEAETSALAYRQARNEGLKGDDLDSRMRDLINDPASEVRKLGTDTAIRLAFQEHGKLVKKVSALVHDENIFSKNFLRYVMPFVTTPFNILETGVRKSPFGSIKLGKKIFDAVKSGDWSDVPIRAAEQTLAWGTTLALMYNNDPANPWITGGDDKQRPYAVKIGGTWYSYGRIEPFATMLGLMVDSINRVHKGADVFDAMKGPFDALLKRVDNQTFFAGISDLMKAAQSDRPTDDILKMATKFPASWVPNLIRAPIRAMDENVPERRVWGHGEERTDRLLRRGLQNLEVVPDHAKFDLWGRAVPKDGGWGPNTDWLVRVFSPSGAAKYQETIGDRIIRRWNAANPNDPVEFKIPNPYFTENGKTHYFTDSEYEQYVREAGKLTQQRVIAAQASGSLNMNEPKQRDVDRLKAIIEQSRERVRNAVKRSRRHAA